MGDSASKESGNTSQDQSKISTGDRFVSLTLASLHFTEDVEIILLKARLEQTEKTLERLIGKNISSDLAFLFILIKSSQGQMGALTAGLAGAGLDLGNFESQDEEEDLREEEEGEEGEEEEDDSEEEEEEEEEEDGVYDEHDDNDSDDISE